MRTDIVPGATFPDYELPDHTGHRRRLSELQGIDPMILHIARGSFCPKEHQMGLQLAGSQSQIEVGNARLVTISTEHLRELNEFRLSFGAQWTFLSDPHHKVGQDLEIEEYTDPERAPVIPHTIVLEPDLIVYKIYNGYWYWGRPSMAELHQDLREIFQRVRPDWDITTPELREAWDDPELRKGNFYPYG